MEHLLYPVLALMYFVPAYGLSRGQAKNLSFAGYRQKSRNKCDTNVAKVVSLKLFFLYRPKFNKRIESSERSLFYVKCMSEK